MLAYMFFTPCFREGKIIGYQANILRRDPKIAKCVLSIFPVFVLAGGGVDHVLCVCFVPSR